MEDNIANAQEVVAGIGAAFAAAGTWVASKFDWWKNSNSKFVKVAVPFGLFIAAMIILSILN